MTNDNTHDNSTAPGHRRSIHFTPVAHDALTRYKLDKQSREGQPISWSDLILGMVDALRERGERGNRND